MPSSKSLFVILRDMRAIRTQAAVRVQPEVAPTAGAAAQPTVVVQPSSAAIAVAISPSHPPMPERDALPFPKTASSTAPHVDFTAVAMTAAVNSAVTPQAGLQNMLNGLTGFLPAPGNGLPNSAVSVVSVVERTLGIGNRRGYKQRGPLMVAELRGGRLEAVVRFQMWGSQSGDAENAGTTLQQALLNARDDLWEKGFLRVTIQGGPLAELQDNPAAWRKTLDCLILYEYIFTDDEAARGLITRISADLGEHNSVDTNGQPTQPMVITLSEFGLWNDQSAPEITLTRRGTVNGIYALVSLPTTWTGSGLTLSSTIGGQPWSKSYISVAEFISKFTPDGDVVMLDGKPFQGLNLDFSLPDFPTPVLLGGGGDIFRISHSSQQLDNINAALYLKLLMT